MQVFFQEGSRIHLRKISMALSHVALSCVFLLFLYRHSGYSISETGRSAFQCLDGLRKTAERSTNHYLLSEILFLYRPQFNLETTRFGNQLNICILDLLDVPKDLTYYNGVNNGFCSILLPFIYSKQWRTSCSRCVKTRYSKSRVAYYSNSIASFQLLLIAGDIHPQPGPLANHDQKPRVLARNALLMGMANVRSLRNKTSDFVDYVCSTNVDIFAITETWLNVNDDTIRCAACPEGYHLASSINWTWRRHCSALS